MNQGQLIYAVGRDVSLHTDPKEAWEEIGQSEELCVFTVVGGKVELIKRISSYDAENYDDFHKNVVYPCETKQLPEGGDS